jgi:hypothetical protein
MGDDRFGGEVDRRKTAREKNHINAKAQRREGAKKEIQEEWRPGFLTEANEGSEVPAGLRCLRFPRLAGLEKSPRPGVRLRD